MKTCLMKYLILKKKQRLQQDNVHQIIRREEVILKRPVRTSAKNVLRIGI